MNAFCAKNISITGWHSGGINKDAGEAIAPNFKMQYHAQSVTELS